MVIFSRSFSASGTGLAAGRSFPASGPTKEKWKDFAPHTKRRHPTSSTSQPSARRRCGVSQLPRCCVQIRIRIGAPRLTLNPEPGIVPSFPLPFLNSHGRALHWPAPPNPTPAPVSLLISPFLSYPAFPRPLLPHSFSALRVSERSS